MKGTKSVTPIRPAPKPAEDLDAEISRIDFKSALSKARAAAALAEICSLGDDYLQMPRTAISEDEAYETRRWIESFAHDALREALDEAEAAGQAEREAWRAATAAAKDGGA